MDRLKTPVFLFLLFSFSFSYVPLAGQAIIQGKVTDDAGNALIGVSMLVVGTTNGTATDIDGQFRLEVPPGKRQLMAAYTGFQTMQKEVYAEADSTVLIDFILQPGSEALHEIVVESASRKARSKKKKTGRYRKGKGIVTHSIAAPKAELRIALDRVDKSTAMSDDLQSQINPGTLTAGEIHDFSKWELWGDIIDTDLQSFRKIWAIDPSGRFTVQLMTHDGYPVIDASVKLYHKNTEIWTGRTDNLGKAELWSNMFLDGPSRRSDQFTARILFDGKAYEISDLKPFKEGINHLKLEAACQPPNHLDVLFVVDATGSMGDEISYLQKELEDIIQSVQFDQQNLQVNLGSVFYRDKEDDYLTRKQDFSAELAPTLQFIKEQTASGGGDYPEAMDKALEVAIEEMNWSSQAVARLLFLVMDAPPHQDKETIAKMQKLTAMAAGSGIRIIPVSGSGIDKSTEFLVRSLALATNGTYVFLTDHSGIGNPHLEPTTDSYDVEKFNDLLIRLIKQFSSKHSCDQSIALKDPIRDDSAKDPENKLTCYPNPTTGISFVTIENPVQHLFLTDAVGKVLMKIKDPQPGKMEINLANFPSGTYFVKVEDDSYQAAGKIVLSRL